MSRLFQRFLAALFLVALAACSGGGCSSGCGIGDMTPLPDGFPEESRIENAAALRLTEPGLRFIEANIPALAGQFLDTEGQSGVITFEVPKDKGSSTGISYEICPDGPRDEGDKRTCTVEIDLGNSDFRIDATDPHNLKITGTLKIRLYKLPFKATAIGFIPVNSHAAISGGDCPGSSFASIDLSPGIDISLETDTNPSHGSRAGLSKLDVKSLDFNQNQLRDSIRFCTGAAWLINVIKGLVVNQLLGGLTGTLNETINEQLCQAADPTATPPCPPGSQDVDGTCRFGDKKSDPCVAMALGTEGHMDLGGMLSSFSPGTSGAIDVMFALGGPSERANGRRNGDLEAANGGATLRLMGGAIPSPQSSCVPMSDMPLPKGITIPKAFSETNQPANWPADYPGPHAGLVVSERFFGYALASAYNSGLLCLGTTTDTVDMLHTGLFSILVPSIGTLTQKKSSQLALAVRPQKPPVVTFGNGTDLKKDPNIRLTLPEVAIDFYVWSTDRFVRAFTATLDLGIPLILDVSKEGLTPRLEDLNIENARVTNSDLLKEDPSSLANTLTSVIGSFAGELTGSLGSPIDLSSALDSVGLTIELPPSEEGKGSPAIGKIEQDGESFLNLWLALGVADSGESTPRIIASQTDAVLTDKVIDPAGLHLATMTDENKPFVRVRASSSLDDGSRFIEYSYRVGNGIWKPWTRNRFLEIRDPSFILQGKHTVEIASRVVGHPKSEGEVSRIQFIVDIEAPVIEVGRVQDGKVDLDVWDRVSHEDDILVRFALDDGAFSAWLPASELRTLDVGDASVLSIEAKDEEENIASTRQALIRGRKDPTLEDASSGCGCSVPGQTGDSNLGYFAAALGALGLFRLRKRKSEPTPPSPSSPSGRGMGRRLLSAAGVLLIAGSYGGCSCSGNQDAEEPPSGYECSEDPDCFELSPGLIGAYSSAAVASDGTIWVSGYSDADYAMNVSFGDLVVGRWNAEREKVGWVQVDGVPEDAEADEFYTGGFRAGISQPGDDVGLWTSVAVDSSDNPHVAYYDVTNKALKFASFDGENWAVSVVEKKDSSDIGRYAKALFMPNGNPAIAYLAMEPGADGFVTSKVRVAIAKSPSPSGPSDWSFEDAAVSTKTPCRASFCKRNQEACDAKTGRCLETAKCESKCSSGKACVKSPDNDESTCRDAFDNNKLDAYPEAHGLYVSAALTPKGEIGIVYYDRLRGNLMQAQKVSGAWKATILDGQTGTAPDEVDTGDVGIGASLFIDSKGDWHISYVDGNSEGLKYLRVEGGATIGKPEVVDDGLGVGDSRFSDGQHIVGDDSNIVVTASGQIQISYQDATSGTLRWAVGTPQSGEAGHHWELKVIEQDGFAGGFSKQIVTTSGTLISNFWRKGGESVLGDVRLVSP